MEELAAILLSFPRALILAISGESLIPCLSVLTYRHSWLISPRTLGLPEAALAVQRLLLVARALLGASVGRGRPPVRAAVVAEQLLAVDLVEPLRDQVPMAMEAVTIEVVRETVVVVGGVAQALAPDTAPARVALTAGRSAEAW